MKKPSRFQVRQGAHDFDNCQPSAVAFSPDDRWLVVARSWPGLAVLWDWQQQWELIWMDPHYESLNDVAFLPDGKAVAVAGRR
jgi:WD40 repeat protein